MTPPPISIDGTEITGATIDGQEVQEITIDGDTVFTAGPDLPNSTVFALVPTVTSSLLNNGSPVSDGGAIDEVLDQSGNGNDAAGGFPTREDNVQNGKTVIRSVAADGDGFAISDSNFTTLSQPFTVIAVIISAGTGQFQRFLARGEGIAGTNVQCRREPNDEFSMFAGSNLSSGLTRSPPLLYTAIFDGANSRIRIDSTEQNSGDAGDNPLKTLGILSRDFLDASSGEDPLDGDVGDIRLFDADLEATGELSNQESALSTKYNI
jgi:hypothetical protein